VVARSQGTPLLLEEMLRCLIGASEAFDRAEKLTQSIGMKL
jgi:hypothetical protein